MNGNPYPLVEYAEDIWQAAKAHPAVAPQRLAAAHLAAMHAAELDYPVLDDPHFGHPQTWKGAGWYPQSHEKTSWELLAENKPGHFLAAINAGRPNEWESYMPEDAEDKRRFRGNSPAHVAKQVEEHITKKLQDQFAPPDWRPNEMTPEDYYQQHPAFQAAGEALAVLYGDALLEPADIFAAAGEALTVMYGDLQGEGFAEVQEVPNYSGILTPTGVFEPLRKSSEPRHRHEGGMEFHEDVLQRLGLLDVGDGGFPEVNQSIRNRGVARIYHDQRAEHLGIDTRHDKIHLAKKWFKDNVDPEHVKQVTWGIHGLNGGYKSTDQNADELYQESLAPVLYQLAADISHHTPQGNAHVGTLFTDGRVIYLDPPGSIALEEILAHPVYDVNTGQRINPQMDPDRFIAALPHKYTSQLRATVRHYSGDSLQTFYENITAPHESIGTTDTTGPGSRPPPAKQLALDEQPGHVYVSYSGDSRRVAHGQMLATSPAIGETNVSGNSGYTGRLSLQSGHKGYFKPGDSENYMRPHVVPGEGYKNEVAVSHLAGIIDPRLAEMYPLVTKRWHNGRIGSMALHGDATPAIRMAEGKRYGLPGQHGLAAGFEEFIDDTDQNLSNMGILPNGGLWNWDKGQALGMYPEAHRHGDRRVLVHAAHQNKIEVPNLLHWEPKWGKMANAMEQTGLDPRRIENAKNRFDRLMSISRAKAGRPLQMVMGQTDNYPRLA